MSAEADAICGAEYGERSEERVNSRNGYRPREWDTRAGTIELAIPKLRHGLVLPGLAAATPPPGRAGLVSRGGHPLPARGLDAAGGEARRAARRQGAVEVAGQSEMAAHLDVQVEAFRNRPLDAAHVHVRVDGRPDDEGPRTRPDGQRRTPWSRSVSTPTATARSSAWTSPPTRTAPAGWRSCDR